MVVKVEELINRSAQHLKTGNKEEALTTALAATKVDPLSSDAWWQLALVREALGDARNVIEPLRKTVELEDVADGAWAKLGKFLFQLGEKDESKEACLNALALNEKQAIALLTIVDILLEEDNEDDDQSTIKFLESLEEIGILTSGHRFRLANLQYRNEQPLLALANWKEDVGNAAAEFNTGLCYNHYEINQGLDALDIWTLLNNRDSNYQPLEKVFPDLKQKMTTLRDKVLPQKSSYLARTPFEIYVCPFQILNIRSETDAYYETIQETEITKLKKSLLSEIELEDGKISWVKDLKLDKSRAIATVEDFLKNQDSYAAIADQPRLRRFLTHGDIEHFTAIAGFDVLHAYFHFHVDPDLRMFVGKYFAPQFDRCITLAIKNKDFPVIEALMSGRRWIAPEQEDLCFEGARRSVRAMFPPLEKLLVEVKEREPKIDDLDSIFKKTGIIEILNLLPNYFDDVREEFSELVRSICLSIFEHHQNADLSKLVLKQIASLKFQSPRSIERLTRDNEQLDEIIARERINEVSLTQGGKSMEITKDEVRRGDSFFKTSEIDGIRFGTLFQNESGVLTGTFEMYFRSDSNHNRSAKKHEREWNNNIEFKWTSKSDLEAQKEFFSRLIDAALTYVVPDLVVRTKAKIQSGSNVIIGKVNANSLGLVTATRLGIEFETSGWFRNTQQSIPWRNVGTELKQGTVKLFDKLNPRVSIDLDARQVDNAIVLFLLISNGELK